MHPLCKQSGVHVERLLKYVKQALMLPDLRT